MRFKTLYIIFCFAFYFKANAYQNSLYWKTKFDTYASEINFYTNMQSISTTGSVVQFEQVAHGLNALLGMYKATEEMQYLDAALTYAENIIASSHLLQVNETDAGILHFINIIN